MAPSRSHGQRVAKELVNIAARVADRRRPAKARPPRHSACAPCYGVGAMGCLTGDTRFRIPNLGRICTQSVRQG